MGEWPGLQPHTDLLLTPSKVTQTPPRSADSWATTATQGEVRNNASPCILRPSISPHWAEKHRGQAGGGTRLGFQSGLETGSFSPSELWSMKGGWSLGLSRGSLSLLHPFSRCAGPHGDDGRGGIHTRIRKPEWLCCGQGRYQGVGGLRVQDTEPEFPLQS